MGHGMFCWKNVIILVNNPKWLIYSEKKPTKFINDRASSNMTVEFTRPQRTILLCRLFLAQGCFYAGL